MMKPAEDLYFESENELDAQSKNVNAWEEAYKIERPSKQHWPHDATSWADSWPRFALLDYTASWYEHVQQADAIEMTTDQDAKQKMRKAPPAAVLPNLEHSRSQIHRFFCDKAFHQIFENWLDLRPNPMMPNGLLPRRLSRLLHILTVPPSPLWLASLLNLPDNVRRLLQSGHSVDGCLNNSASTPETILPAPTAVRAENLESWGRKPVQIAATAGNLEALGLLLESNAILEQSEFDWVASSNYWHGPAVLSIILKARPHLVVSQDTVKAAKKNRSAEILRYFRDTPDILDPSADSLMDLVKHSIATSGIRSKFRDWP